MCFSRGCRHPCAILQCWMFEKTIITDRAEKDAKRRQLEQDALELKSILKVKGSKAVAVLFHQQVAVNHLYHRLCSGRKWPEKVGWCGAAQAKDTESLSLSSGADTKPAASCRFEKGSKGRSQSPQMTWGRAPHTSPTARGGYKEGHRAVPLLIPLPPATDALSPDTDTFTITSTGPTAAAWARGSLLQLGSAGEMLWAIDLYQILQQVISSKTSLSLPLASSCRPGGEVQWSAETLAPTRPSGRFGRNSYQSRQKKGRRKNMEQRKRHDKQRNLAPALLLGRALWLVSLSVWQHKINHVTELRLFWRTWFMTDTVKVKLQ